MRRNAKRVMALLMSFVMVLTLSAVGLFSVSAASNSNTIVKRGNKWVCIDNKGNYMKNANGIYKNKYGWWKTTNGVVNFKETGIFKNEFGWWRVEKSKVNFKANGIYKNNYGWWKTTDGKVTFKENGIFENDYGWWRVSNSKVDFNANSIYKNQYGWWKTTNGKVTFDETGIFKNDHGYWYVENSKVNFTKNGKVTFNGNSYRVTDGKAVPLKLDTAVVSFEANGTDVTNMPEALIVTVNESIVEPLTPTKEGYYFEGWFVDAVGREKYNFSLPVTKDLTLYAKWSLKTDVLNDDIIDRSDIELLSDEGTIAVTYNQKGKLLTIDGKFTNKKVLSAEDASEVLNSSKPLFGDEFTASTNEIDVQSLTNDDIQKETFFRFRPIKNGIPVLGSQIVISTDKKGAVIGLTNSYDSRIESVDTTPVLTYQEAERIAIDYLMDEEVIRVFLNSLNNSTSKEYDEIVNDFKSIIEPKTELIITFDEADKPALAYAVSIKLNLYLQNETDDNEIKELEIDETYHINANDNSGSLIKKFDNFKNATDTMTASDLLNKNRTFGVNNLGDHYELKDLSRKVETYNCLYKYKPQWDKLFDSINFIKKECVYPGKIVSFNRNPSKTEVSVHANLCEIYDYYNNVLNRKSFDDKGGTIKATIKNNNMLTPNAAWSHSLKQMCYVTNELCPCLDVTAHEFTHAVISYVVGKNGDSGMDDAGEPAALEEAYADIMGNLIENKKDKGKWLLGEDSKNFIKNDISNPSNYGLPDHYVDYNAKKKPHHNSAIFSHAAYKMMADSRTASISNEKWAKVFYNSLYNLTNTATFLQARGCIVMAAKGYGFTSSQVQAIKDAFDAVGIFGSDSEGHGMIFGGHTYNIIYDKFESFEDAENYCVSLGGHMAVIETPEEDRAVYAFLKDEGVESAFLGMYEETEGVWVDVLGNSVNSRYTNWGAGEPNNVDGKEWIIQYYSDYPNGQWNDLYWGKEGIYTFIIEWDHK